MKIKVETKLGQLLLGAQVIFLVIKLTGLVSWSWWLIMLPLICFTTAVFAVGLILSNVYGIEGATEWLKTNRLKIQKKG